MLGTGAATIYTTPATGAILRTIKVANTTATAASFTLSIGVDAAGTRMYSAVSIPGNSTFTTDLFMPLASTEVLQAYASAATSLTITIGAIEL